MFKKLDFGSLVFFLVCGKLELEGKELVLMSLR